MEMVMHHACVLGHPTAKQHGDSKPRVVDLVGARNSRKIEHILEA
jgi:hypothetical protein